jgi:hypothetical protein
VCVVLAVATARAQTVPSPAAARTTRDGLYSLEQARRGAKGADRCVPCHGPDLQGDAAPPLVGIVYQDRWEGRPLTTLFERIVVNLEWLKDGREDHVTPLEQQAADVLAFLLLENGYRAGTTELPPHIESLNGITIVAPLPMH